MAVFAPMGSLLRAPLHVCLFVLAAPHAGLAGTVPGFTTEIAPLLQRRCVGCHGEENAKGRYRLDTFARLTRAGDSGLPPLVAGKPRESELYNLLLESDATDRMPQKADPLPPAEIALIERWIAGGAVYDGGAPDRRLAELARGAMLRPAPERYPRPAPVTALAFSPDARQLAVSGYCEVTIWNLDDTTLARRIGGLPERITGLAWHPKKKLLAVAGGSPAQWGSVALVDPATDEPPRFLCDLADTALCVAFSPDGTRLAAGGADRALRLFDTASGKTLRVSRLHADWVQSVAFDGSGERIVTGSRDRTAKVIEVRTGELDATYSGHDTALLGAVFVGDDTVASIARGKSVQVWAVRATAKSKPALVDFPTDALVVAAMRGGFATAGADRLVRLHQTSDQRQLLALAGHGDVVQSLAVAPGEGLIASGSADGTVCVWSPACETWLRRFVASPR
jgi:hypothetical protein